MMHIAYRGGTLEIRDVADPTVLPSRCQWDDRSRCYRAPAMDYAEIVMGCVRRKEEYEDAARAYDELPAGAQARREPRPFQAEALEAWRKQRGRGVVVLPTGAGKSHVAVMAIDAMRRSTLVVAPTLDLVRQWYDLLRSSFPVGVGVVGGGDYAVAPLTVTTYDSAYIHMEHLGNRFGLVVFDECHHLPGDAYALAARFCLAPFRLGLTATPERADGRHVELDELIGPVVYARDIVELAGDYLAEYEVEQIIVELSPAERAAYDEARAIYRDFVSSNGISFRRPDGWQRFIQASSRSREGRRAMEAYLRQRQLAFAAPSKMAYLEHLLHVHRADRTLVFTQDNATAYDIARRFLIPVITHQTRVTERSEILAGLAEGTYGAVATSKVLNEGVDVPDANVAVIVSGSGSVREHVQRLGRVLRKRGDKRAVLYELVAGGTAEAFTSERRRDHVAYR
jgi:superfamily II DNA or RNA helicase